MLSLGFRDSDNHARETAGEGLGQRWGGHVRSDDNQDNPTPNTRVDKSHELFKSYLTSELCGGACGSLFPGLTVAARWSLSCRRLMRS